MDLQKHLGESGYTEAAKRLDDLKAAIAIAKANLAAGILPKEPLVPFLADLAEMEIRIPKMEKALADEYASAVALVDAQNDLDLTMLDLEERAEMVLEYVEQDHPDAPATAEIRGLVEKIRSNEE
ncbi:MAG: hypothetical protein IPG67_17885 [Acidobacteria bacterium]|nr:hypothetical protein [Acidobacteriota bacterium]MBK7935259.1 hypothetical protein [Acidobacteriota bacterium]